MPGIASTEDMLEVTEYDIPVISHREPIPFFSLDKIQTNWILVSQ